MSFLAFFAFTTASPAAAPSWSGTRITQFGRLAVGFSAGGQFWSLSGLEEALDERSALYALDGFELEEALFGPGLTYAGDLQYRIGSSWFIRSQFEWTRFSVGDRDRQFISVLGGRERTPISLTYETQVKTDPVFAILGVGRSLPYRSVRFALVTSLIIAPIEVVDVLEVHLDSTTESRIVASGTGYGFDANVTIDYFTDVRMTLFVESFFRAGSTIVELEEGFWESSSVPGSRRVDFDGFGFRLGLRWI